MIVLQIYNFFLVSDYMLPEMMLMFVEEFTLGSVKDLSIVLQASAYLLPEMRDKNIYLPQPTLPNLTYVEKKEGSSFFPFLKYLHFR